MNPPGSGIVSIVGPTAVGKSALTLKLAQEFGGEVVTADSRQVYRYMDIGTAKPSTRERAMVPHHMLDLVQPNDVYSAQRYREEGRRVLRLVAERRRIPFVAGGTGFYTRALLDDLSIPEVPPNPGLREQLREEASRHGTEALHARLATVDPASAERIMPRNLPRLIRALEIVDRLGGPVPALATQEPLPALRLGLTMDRRKLWEVADLRIDRQIEAGLVEETEALLAMGYDPDGPALSGFGYRHVVAYLTGIQSRDQAIQDYKTATRQYIRRQMTWFRADLRIQWVEVDDFAYERCADLVRMWTSQRLKRPEP